MKKRRFKKKYPVRQHFFSIVYEDNDIILISKTAGLLAVPIKGSRARNARDLLNEYLTPQKQKAIIVHRIDRYTSGLMVFAKNKRSHAHLVKQFLAHTPNRIYLTLVRGIPEPAEGSLRHYLKLTLKGFRQEVVTGEAEGGTLAETRYKVLDIFKNSSLLELQLVSGLKNQIRVQLAAQGHPIVGDRHYNPAEKKEKLIDRQALHAYRLGFIHPGRERYVEFQAELPRDFKRILNFYRG